jgi:acyl-CoA synthetase (AMP-forming)/AMP-acid ligase II
MRRDTLLDFFDDVSTGRGNFFVYDDGFRTRSYTYAETARAGARVCRAPASRGPRERRQSCLLEREPAEWIIALWGCLLNGSIAVPIDFRASHDFLASVAASSAPKYFCSAMMLS